jgi:hypothetical protein
MVTHVEILAEEPSMEAALRLIIPKISDALSFEIYPYRCKQDLLGKLPARLKGYAAWLPQDWRILVIVDRDDDDCAVLKRKLEKAARDSGLISRTRRAGGRFQVVNRLAIEELEAWFFGDWDAVCAAYPGVDPNVPSKSKYRDPDAVLGGTWEALERILKRAGHFQTGLRKIEAARAIAQHMDPRANRSRSFQAFRDAVVEMTS